MGKRRRYVTQFKAGGRILDIGCATGAFLLAMQMHGRWQVNGVELNDKVARIACERYGLEVFAGTLEEARFPAAHFDAVTLWDVLEHLHDPMSSLREIHRILKPGGIVVLRVPNLRSWDAHLFGEYWAGFDAPRHLYVFTPQMMNELLARSGFTVLNHDTAIGSYVTFVLSIRFWLTARRVSPRVQRTILVLFNHPLARLVSAPIFFLPNLIRRGPLLVTIARKPGSEPINPC
jgi:SAM-dependent methyltransferase